MAFIPLSSATTNHPQYMTSIPKNTSNDTWKISKGSRYFDELSITLASPSDQLGPSTSLQNGRLSPFLRPERYRQRKPIVCNSPLQPMQRNSQSPSINGPIDLAEDMSNLPNRFIAFGMRLSLCPTERMTNVYSYNNLTTGETNITWRKDILIYGKLYPFDEIARFLKIVYNISLTSDYEGANLSPLFDADVSHACSVYPIARASKCAVVNPYYSAETISSTCIPIQQLNNWYTSNNWLEFNWRDIQLASNGQPSFLVLSDFVLDIRSYQSLDEKPFGDRVDNVIKQAIGQDATYLFSAWQDTRAAWQCVLARYTTGVISNDTMGCIAYDIIINFFLSLILALLGVKLLLAIWFHWFMSHWLIEQGKHSRRILSWGSITGGSSVPKQHRASNSFSFDTMNSQQPFNHSHGSIVDNEPCYTILFVTCYSEGMDSIKNTLDSLADTTYSTKHKLLFIVVDGIITGEGNNKPTSDICLSLLTPLNDNNMHQDGKECEYEAVADGWKQKNKARVYMGYYRSLPALVVIKSGTEHEKGKTKAGNRGKRDSQMILMSFFKKVLFYEKFTELEYEMFWKMSRLMKKGVTPDKFELVLMVDADTKVAPDCITHMVSAMKNDITVMGVCGETKIANKSESWVTAIQVFEYFVSHHYAKAFESVFGGVTCLPGCFSMYRIKAPKQDRWVPILSSPEIIEQFNVSSVDTLHAKNLLLLGEDRFLTTLMLRTFPRRQMILVPQAKSKTVVPNSFKVLLSQRRRWINSTIHNLMELVFVSELCGIACLSMQFVVALDLLSSVVLPAATLLIFFFFIDLIFTHSAQYQTLVILLAAVGTPALLVIFTAKRMTYIGWMIVYIFAFPIWNFVMPIYSFWHFDDFSWGETRRVVGEKEEDSNSDPMCALYSEKAQKKYWHVWESERLSRLKHRTHSMDTKGNTGKKQVNSYLSAVTRPERKRVTSYSYHLGYY
ncbi:unnamed protein product [Rhizopus microsporus]